MGTAGLLVGGRADPAMSGVDLRASWGVGRGGPLVEIYLLGKYV